MNIKEVSRKHDISVETLRYYERIGLIPPVTRSKNGYRDYSEYDENWVDYIKAMRNAGISVETLIEYVTLFRQGKDTIPARKDLLLVQREDLARKVAEMQGTLDRLDRKIEGYEERVLKYEANELDIRDID